ncbi:FkbM family methyltransferase [Parvularcula oceani]|uniref:FkbM family methyltransferase n=1 Tax=Parvularcula oceani TaxID=1247963 RepID=UPI0004E278AB|nr:FkbM family methyltransferase [Parvularcula oceani]
MVQPFAVPMRDGTILTHASSGLSYLVPGEDVHAVERLAVRRTFRPHVVEALRRFVLPDRDVVEIGGSFGFFTCYLASLLDPMSGRVLSFEPNPELARLIRLNADLNSPLAPVTVVEAAAASRPGVAVLHIPAAAPSEAALMPARADETFVGASEIEISCERADSVAASTRTVGLIKLDAGSGTLDALEGCRALIERVEDIVIVLRWHGTKIERSPLGVDGICAFFEEYGLEARVIDSAGECPRSFWNERNDREVVDLVLRRSHVWDPAEPSAGAS